jgi:riboflavin kinase/FMN adenylyltransferase
LRPCHIIIGDDFRFGKGREGDLPLLQAMAKQLEFSIVAMPTLLLEDERVSSTRVRQALMENNLVLAARLLGRPYTMQGRVRHGDALGQQLGFPTANIHLHRRLTPVKGIFTVYMHGLTDKPLPGVANIGTRPTVGGTRTLLEVHLLDFNQNIYGRYIEVEFCQKLREEERYPSLELLKEQIARDVVVARDYFEGGSGS